MWHGKLHCVPYLLQKLYARGFGTQRRLVVSRHLSTLPVNSSYRIGVALSDSGIRTSLEALRRRLQQAGRFTASRAADCDSAGARQVTLLIVDAQLAIPRIVTEPSLEEAQAAVSAAVQTILATSEHVTPWQHFNRQQLQMQRVWRKDINLPVLIPGETS